MKKLVLFFALCCMTAVRAWASGAEFYAVPGNNGTKLTVYYDENRMARNGIAEWYSLENRDLYQYDESVLGVGHFINNVVTVFEFDSSVKNARPTSISGWFRMLVALKEIRNLDYLNTADVTDMSYLFMYCHSLSDVNVTSFNTEKVTNMSGMFYSCGVKRLDLRNFNIGNVTDMSSMFNGCSNLETISIVRMIGTEVKSCILTTCSRIVRNSRAAEARHGNLII